MNLKFIRRKGKPNLTELADKFDKWADELEKVTRNKGLESAVYHRQMGSYYAYRTAAQEIRELLKVN